jgi:hypothetical protein
VISLLPDIVSLASRAFCVLLLVLDAPSQTLSSFLPFPLPPRVNMRTSPSPFLCLFVLVVLGFELRLT